MKWTALLFIIPLFSLSLKESLMQGSPGDFVIYDQNRTYTALILQEVKSTELVLEEISVPSHKKKESNWRTWLERGAPECTSWVRYRIDTRSEKLLEAYSVSRECWLPIDGNDPLIATLIRETLITIPESKRKHLSAKPGQMNRPLWNPPLFINGTKQKKEMTAYTAYWPNDSSELSSQPLELYFDISFPFPYWIELTSHNFRIRAVDSGKGLTIQGKKTPTLPPKILTMKKTEDELIIEIHNPSHITNFTLYFIQDKGGVRSPLPCKILKQEQIDAKLHLSVIAPSGPGEISLIPEDHPHLSHEAQIK
jgi:hypothetical protein